MKIYILVDASHDILKVTSSKEKCEEYVEELNRNYEELNFLNEVLIKDTHKITNCSLTDAWKRTAELIHTTNVSENVKCSVQVYANHFNKECKPLKYAKKDCVKILEWEVE